MSKKLKMNYKSLLLSSLTLSSLGSMYALFNDSMVMPLKLCCGIAIISLSMFVGYSIGNIYKESKSEAE